MDDKEDDDLQYYVFYYFVHKIKCKWLMLRIVCLPFPTNFWLLFDVQFLCIL